MTDQLDTETPEITREPTGEGRRGIDRRRMFLAGAGLAGAAVFAKTSSVSAADGDNVILGRDATDVGFNESDSTTEIVNSGTSTDRTNNAIKGTLSSTDNNSHAVLGVTEGEGHAVAGVVNNTTEDAVAATWGRHFGPAAATEGQSMTENQPIAGPANGVKGIVEMPTNGSHAVLGITNGGGHAVAGDTPADAAGAGGTGVNTVAATWGRHQGVGAGIGGISVDGYGGEFVGGKASVRLIPSTDVADGPPTDEMHSVGELFVDGRGDLYYNTAEGANFTRLNSQGGTVVLPVVQRAYDSREEYTSPANTNKGRHGTDEVREIDLTEFTDLPASAQGAIINLTVAETDALGFALVYNGDTTDTPVASSINWVDAGEFIANGITVAVGATGTVNVYTLVPTEIIIDVAGYIT